MTEHIRRRAAIEPVIGHMKAKHRLDRNYLLGTKGDANNALFAVIGANFRRLLAWLAVLLSVILALATGKESAQIAIKA